MKKLVHYFLIGILACCSYTLVAQSNGNVDDKPLYSVEQMPQYPGGDEALLKFIKDNLHYPQAAAEKGIEGRVTIRFVINREGAVTDVTVIRGLDSACDNEAMRVVKMMPTWIPGKQNGKNISVYYTLPVVYKLNKDTSALNADKPVYGVEVMPQFPEGEKALMAFISNNLQYPNSDARRGIQGRVTVRFVVNKVGEVCDVTVIRGLSPGCDAEAVRVIKMMPNWIPGRQKGNPVSVYYTLPIVYKLQK